MLKSTPDAETTLAEKLIKRLPDSVRVGAYDFRIVRWSSLEASAGMKYGECSTIEQNIKIQVNMPSRYKAVDTFIHELLHAMYWAYGVEDEDKEERIVGMLASAWVVFHRDNPWYFDWIKSAEL